MATSRPRVGGNGDRSRGERGLSQQALADKRKIHRVSLAKSAGALQAPSLEILERLAQAVKVKVGKLLEEKSVPPHELETRRRRRGTGKTTAATERSGTHEHGRTSDEAGPGSARLRPKEGFESLLAPQAGLNWALGAKGFPGVGARRSRSLHST
jgi:transcriptional regulator with XRE-family HTH domain